EMPDAYLPAGDIERISPHLPHQSPQRESSLARYAAVPAGLTLAAAGLADSGTLVQPGGKGLSRLASLLPAIHFAVLPASTLYTNLAAWLSAGGAQLAAQAPGLVLISGPSRTADIEMSLTIGVHGPRQVVVFCLQDK
ncbi:MAG: LUD domain-containing protein, partial [Anaerolineae bacterium]|nr:LUD domain-containing protein [Anaerolineae bacterium]